MGMRRRRPEEIRRDALLRREPEPAREPAQMRATYVGRLSPALRGRTALVMRRRSGVLVAQFDYPADRARWWDTDYRDPMCHGWHEFTEGEFEIHPETPKEREGREARENRLAERAYRRALADFGGSPRDQGAPMGGPSRAHYYDPSDDNFNEDWEYGMDHLVGLDGWGND